LSDRLADRRILNAAITQVQELIREREASGHEVSHLRKEVARLTKRLAGKQQQIEDYDDD
jgi:ABC-type transporter Mla subunit MlaD